MKGKVDTRKSRLAQPSIGRGSIPSPRTKPAAVRRRELLEAAEKLFLEYGVAATSVDEIVAGAGVAKGTFYLHFSSKERLMTALRERFVDDYLRDLRVAMDGFQPDDWKGRLHAWVDAGVAGYLGRVALHDVVFHEFPSDDRRTKCENPVVDLLARLLSDGTKAGAWSVKGSRRTAVMLFHALHGAVDDAIAERAPGKRLAREVRDFFFRVVGS